MIKQDVPVLSEHMRGDHRAILGLVEHGARVLDLGCGDGELLALLVSLKGVEGGGIEIDEQSIYTCVSRGLSVSHQDIDCGLSDYSDKSFDYVILNQSLQQVKHLESVLQEALRVGKKVIVGFPNFAYIKARCQMFFSGRTPVTTSLPYMWYDTPNLHFLSIADFIAFCREKHFQIKRTYFLDNDRIIRLMPNLFAQVGIFLISD